MNSYPTYKPSGIEWLGDIPEHWEGKRIKNVSLKVQTGTTPKTAISKYYEAEDINWFTPVDFSKDILLVNAKNKISQIAIDEGAGRFFSKGSVLLLGIGATIGKIGILSEDSSANQQINSVTFSNKMNSLFAAYSMKIYETEIIKFANFSTLPIFNQSNTSNLIIGIPPKQEQTAIANYLAEKTSKLDQLIKNKKAQIAQLKEIRQIEINTAVTKGLNPNAKLKPSGIEWLGDIPEHWEVKRLKEISSIWGRIGFRGYNKEDIVLDETEGALTLGAKHISKSNQIRLTDPEYLSWDKYYESPEIMVKLGDLLIVQRGSIGKFTIVESEIGDATINPSMILVNQLHIEPKLIYYILHSKHIQSIIEVLTSSTAVPMISQFQAGTFRIPFSKDRVEQKRIVEHLDDRVSKLDHLVNNLENQIAQLEEVRKIEIFNAVTGKIKIV